MQYIFAVNFGTLNTTIHDDDSILTFPNVNKALEEVKKRVFDENTVLSVVRDP